MSIYTYPGATAQQIGDLERHANVKLPEQYVQFLSKHGGMKPNLLTVGSTFFEGDRFLKQLALVGADYSEVSLYGFYPLEDPMDNESTLFHQNGPSSCARLFSEVLSHPFIFARIEYGDLAFNADGVDQSVYYVEVVHDHYDLETAQKWTYHSVQEEYDGIVPTHVAQRVADSFDEFYQMWWSTLRDDIRFYPVLNQSERERLLPMVENVPARTQALDLVTVLYTLKDVEGYLNNPMIQADVASVLVDPDDTEVCIDDESLLKECERKVDLLSDLLTHQKFALELKYVLGESLETLAEDLSCLIDLQIQSMKQVIKRPCHTRFTGCLTYELSWRYDQYLAMMFLFGFEDKLKESIMVSVEFFEPISMDYLPKTILERLAGVRFNFGSTVSQRGGVVNHLITVLDDPQLPKPEIDRLMIEYLDHAWSQFDPRRNRYSIDIGESFFAYDVALVVGLLGLDDSAFRDHVVYPKDLVDYYREHHQR